MSYSDKVDESDNENIYLVCMKKQLEEYYLLSSAYTSEEISLKNGEELIRRLEGYTKEKEITNSDLRSPPDHIDYNFCLNLSRSGKKTPIRLKLNINLPHLYPKLEKPFVDIFSEDIDRAIITVARQALLEFVDTLNTDEPYVFEIIYWLQENLETYIDKGEEVSSCSSSTLYPESNISCLLERKKTQVFSDQQQEKQSASENQQNKWERIWIYSHHIAAASKRQQILQLSRRFDLSGFSRPGKPGIICVEGLHENAQKFWQHIKSLQWQKIRIVKIEFSNTDKSLEDFRRFTEFQEISFLNDEENADRQCGHKPLGLDMKSFIKFLESHNCGYMKKELFGI